MYATISQVTAVLCYFSLKQQLTSAKCESELKSQQTEACIAEIGHLSKEIEVLTSSLQEKEVIASRLQSELEKHQQAAITPEKLLELIKLRTQIAELECRLQEAGEQKQKAELEKEMAIKEMEAQKKFQMQLHAQLGKLWIKTAKKCVLSSISLYLLRKALSWVTEWCVKFIHTR